MRASARSLAAMLLTFGVAPVAGAAGPRFSGDVCGLAPPAGVAAIPGVSPKCQNQEPLSAPGAIDYVASWSGESARPATLQVTVARYTDEDMRKLAVRNLNQGLPGTPTPIGRIGGGTVFEATGGFATAIRFSVDDYVVLLVVNTVGAAPPKAARTALEGLANAIAARL